MVEQEVDVLHDVLDVAVGVLAPGQLLGTAEGPLVEPAVTVDGHRGTWTGGGQGVSRIKEGAPANSFTLAGLEAALRKGRRPEIPILGRQPLTLLSATIEIGLEFTLGHGTASHDGT